MRENARDAPQGLVGSWRLVSYEDRPASGPAVFPYGTEPKGFLVYDATGHMAIQIMKQPHPKVASGDPYRVTPQEKEALLDAYAAYFGTYRVDAARGIVVHHAEGDLYGLFIGRDEERPFELTGDRLVLKPLWSKNDQKWSGIRVFERVL
ncbi:MAG TPA: lipocalin-like domain-containing protein [Candidatus Dormibacteraeota bacterium]|nr:lipocalin-like domain-containing protein [Candidatus Dormibacteraeota bacterium]